MNDRSIQELCRLIQSGNLPGETAHKDMIPFRPLTSELLPKASDYRESSVAILLYKEDSLWKSVLIERPTYEGVHSGQIAFPGGKRDLTDKNLITTALREMQEEIGFHDTAIHFIGQLSPVYIPVSKFLVYPHVFITEKQYPVFTPDAREVHEIIPFNLEEIIVPDNLISTTVEAQAGIRIKNVPAFSISGKIVWGATCLIVNELKMCIETSTGY